VEDAEKSLRYFQPVRYGEMVSLDGGIKVRFQDAGHILGSAIIELWTEEEGEEKKLVFSGDLGSPAPLSSGIPPSLRRPMSSGLSRPTGTVFTGQRRDGTGTPEDHSGRPP